jgi:cytochrome c oxidase subunit 2
VLTFLGLPPQASRDAAHLDQVLILEHWGMFALALFFTGYLLYVLFRFRAGASPRASYDGMKSHWSVYLVLAIAAAEGVLLVAYEIPGWRERTRNFPAASEATVVRVVADQFSWNVHYPGTDAQFGRVDPALMGSDNPLGLDRRDEAAKDDIALINQMTVPVNKPVLVRLSSKDVIHSFGVYEMRVKQDAAPGFDTPVWFVPTVTTAEMRQRLGRPDFEYEITCSQLCGLGHFRMRGFLTVVTEVEYQSFLAEEARGLPR